MPNGLIQVHLVIHHLAEYVEMEGMSLALLSEQSGESLHSDFEGVWRHYKVKDIEARSYGPNLLRAVVAYNSAHV